MLAIVAEKFDQPSETFVRNHAAHIAPGRTVLLCQHDSGAATLGYPILSDLRGVATPRSAVERIANALRYRWWRYVDPALRGADDARVRTFLKRHGVRVVLAEFGPNGCLLRVACKRAGVPLFVHFHGYDATKLARSRWIRRHYAKLFRDAKGVLVPSGFLADRLRALGCPEGKLHVSPNGVDLHGFSPTRREPGRIIAVSRLVPVKGPLQTIEAFARVLEKVPHATLDIVGEGELKANCVSLAQRLGVDRSITFHGALRPDQVAALMSRASVFVQHSVTAADGQTESFGITLLEASASELPIVATRSGGIVETVKEDQTAILVAEHDVEAMADAIISMLEDPVRAEEMGRAGRDRVEKLFRQEHATARLREVLGMTNLKSRTYKSSKME